MKANKRLYNMGGDIMSNFYPSNNSNGSMITPKQKQEAKEKIERDKISREEAVRKLKKNPNYVINETNIRNMMNKG